MSFLHIDSWPWKIALILGLVLAREFVRVTSLATTRAKAGSSHPPMTPTGRRAPAPPMNENAKWVIETLDSAAIAIGLVLFIIQPFLIQAFFIPSGSMEDTLRIDDRLLVSKLLYRLRDPQFQDVVVFKAPPRAMETSHLTENQDGSGETDFIKRCVGTPGDVVYVINRQVFRKARGEKDGYAGERTLY